MLDDDDLNPGDNVAEPTDAWVETLIRRTCQIPLSQPVPTSLIRGVCAELKSVARRRIRARAVSGELVSAHPHDMSLGAPEDVREVLHHMIVSPHGQAAIYALISAPLFLYAGVEVLKGAALFQVQTRDEASEIHDYIALKVGGNPWPGRFGSRRPFAIVDGCRVPVRSPRERGPSPIHIVAANAVTTARAKGWMQRLEGASQADQRAVLTELSNIGIAAAEEAAPLPLWFQEGGPPRGIWPDPPPPEDPAIELTSLLGSLVAPAPKAGL